MNLPSNVQLEAETVSQQIFGGEITKSDGSTISIASGDVAALATYGVTFEVNSETDSSILKINNSDRAFNGAILTLRLKNAAEDTDDL